MMGTSVVNGRSDSGGGGGGGKWSTREFKLRPTCRSTQRTNHVVSFDSEHTVFEEQWSPWDSGLADNALSRVLPLFCFSLTIMSTIPKTDLHVLLISSLRRVQVITIAGPESASRSNFDARVICQRIQESPARGFIPEAIYQVDIPNTAKVLKSLKGLSPSTSTPVVGPLQQQFFANIQPGRIYLAAYLKASPAAAVAPKRKPSADIKRDDAKKSCNTHTTKAAATRRHVNLTPVDVGIKGYDRHPLYITGRVGDRVQLVHFPPLQVCITADRNSLVCSLLGFSATIISSDRSQISIPRFQSEHPRVIGFQRGQHTGGLHSHAF